MSADGNWLVSFRYNGRIEGKMTRSADLVSGDRADALPLIDSMEKEALRINGAIYVRGWSVDWVDAPLIDNENPDD